MHDSTAPTEAERPISIETLPPPGPHQQPVALPGPHHQPIAPPAAPAAPAVAYPAAYAPGTQLMPTSSSRPGLVLGVISLIASSLALLGVIGLFVWTFTGGAANLPPGLPSEDFGPPPAPLTGQLSEVPNGRQIAAEDLTGEITDRLEEDGWIVEDMRCPQVSGLGQGTVSVCHASLDDGDWAVLVFFEDSKGTYTLSLV